VIWLNPWAWLGLAAIALPVLIHLLGRGQARVERFPTLRFLDTSRLLPTRRTTLNDRLLLVLRVAIIAAAAAAFAHPLLLTRGRRTALERGLARAIVVDSSASMRRTTSDGRSALDVARTRARALAAQATASIVVESSDPASALGAAAAWLEQRETRGEIVLISDFQAGQVEREDFAAVASGIGLTMSRVVVAASDSVVASSFVDGYTLTSRTSAGSGADAGMQRFEWRSAPAPTVPGVELLATMGDADAIAATQRAAAARAVPLPIDSSRRVAIVFPSYANRGALLRSRTPAREAWMHAAVSDAGVARSISAFGEDSADGHSRLLLFSAASPGTIASATLLSAAERARSMAPTAAELEPEIVADSTLTAWQRPAPNDVIARADANAANGPSDARWLWGLVLLLLMAETLVRRLTPTRAATGEPSSVDRAA
jgi:hypothetical protein